MRRMLFAIVIASLTASAGPAAAQRYQALTDDAGRLQELVDEIRDLIDEVDRARAADPRFVRDVRAVLGGYDNPWSVPLVDEDFRDGNFTRNPAWVVEGGDVFVSLRDGLHVYADPSRLALARTAPRREESRRDNTAAGILGRIITEVLNEGDGATTAPTPRATAQTAGVYLPLRITGAFSLTAEVSATDPRGVLELSVYRGAGRSEGYAPVLTPGVGINLVRRTGRQRVVLKSVPDGQILARGRTHVIGWTRGADGRLTLRLDGAAIAQTADRGVFNSFDGFALATGGGEYVLRSLKISGTAPR